MKLNVSQLQEGENRFSWNSESGRDLALLEKTLKEHGHRVSGPIQLELAVIKLEPDYYLRGSLVVSVEQQCALCSEAVVSKVVAPFELALVRSDKVKANTTRLSEEAEELDLICFEGHELELGALLEEQLVIHLPVRAECGTEECRKRSAALISTVQEHANHWKDRANPFSILEKMKTGKH